MSGNLRFGFGFISKFFSSSLTLGFGYSYDFGLPRTFWAPTLMSHLASLMWPPARRCSRASPRSRPVGGKDEVPRMTAGRRSSPTWSGFLGASRLPLRPGSGHRPGEWWSLRPQPSPPALEGGGRVQWSSPAHCRIRSPWLPWRPGKHQPHSRPPRGAAALPVCSPPAASAIDPGQGRPGLSCLCSRESALRPTSPFNPATAVTWASLAASWPRFCGLNWTRCAFRCSRHVVDWRARLPECPW